MASISGADIVQAIKLCKWIRDQGFVRANAAGKLQLQVHPMQSATVLPTLDRTFSTSTTYSDPQIGHGLTCALRADVRLEHFRNDVTQLEDQLKILSTRLTPLTGQDGRSHGISTSDADSLRQNCAELVGDFLKTLTECKDLIQANAGVGPGRSASLTQNLSWAATTQPKVDDLRSRLQFHIQKIYLVTQSTALGLLETVAGNVAILAEAALETERRENPLPPTPEWLHAKFLEGSSVTGRTLYVEGSNDFPLKEGVEALHKHYSESTVKWQPGLAPLTVDQYMSLRKAWWILEQLRCSDDFVSLPSNSLYRPTVRLLETNVRNEFRRFRTPPFPDMELEQLSPAAFFIWPMVAAIPARTLGVEDDREERILQIELAPSAEATKRELLVFRAEKTALRVVRCVTYTGSGQSVANNDSMRFNTHMDRLVPRYALAENATPCIEFTRGNNTGGELFELENVSNIWDIQRAVTEYKVVSDTDGVNLSGHSGSMFGRRKGGMTEKGKVQLWQWKPLPPIRPSDPNAEGSSRKGSLPSNSVGSGSRASTTASSIAENTIRSFSPSVATIVGDRDRPVIAVERPPVPVLMFYKQSSTTDHYVLWHVELTDALIINPSSCQCKRASKTCAKLVIEASNGSDIVIRELSVTAKEQSKLDLSVFGQPRHPRYKSGEDILLHNCKHITLTFPSVPERVIFAEAFGTVCRIRNADRNDYLRLTSIAHRQSDRPAEVRIGEETRNPSASGSIVTIRAMNGAGNATGASTPDTARRLSIASTGTFDASFVEGFE